jgi:hypothetical protein
MIKEWFFLLVKWITLIIKQDVLIVVITEGQRYNWNSFNFFVNKKLADLKD